MNRRRFLTMGLACASGGWCCSLGAADDLDYSLPQRFSKPEADTDEGGLWALMDREEKALRRSPLLVQDNDLKRYVQNIVCRLAGAHCPDIRVHLVHSPHFNASMAPNGMMQVWTGLLLRADNEAQLAAVLGHEIAHYLQRHSLEALRDIKTKSAFGQFLGLFGIAGAVGQLLLLSSAFAYSRSNEEEADRIGAFLMQQAGYDIGEAAKIWDNLIEELKVQHGTPLENRSLLFSTHPSPPDRSQILMQYAAQKPGGQRGQEAYRHQIDKHMDSWLQEEVKRGQYSESLVLMARLSSRPEIAAKVYFYRGEVYRLRGGEGDTALAIADYRAATQQPNAPAAAFRGIGLIARQQGQKAEASQALSRYLELQPKAHDAELIKNYLQELKS